MTTMPNRELLDVPTEENVPAPPTGEFVEEETAVRSQWRLFWRRFFRHRMAVISSIVLLLIVFACFTHSLALLWLTTACLLLYLVPVESHIVRNDYRLAIESIIYAPFVVLAVTDLWYHRRRAIRSS